MYNNGKKEAKNMSPFEALYGRKCRTPVNWDGLVSKVMLGLEMFEGMQQEVSMIRQHLKVA